MKDRFRVRVWDIERKTYIYDAQFEPNYDVIEDDKQYIPEQCTGMKDKDGKLIYEGDILYDAYVSYGDDDPYAGLVIYKKGAFKFLTGNIEISFDDCSGMKIMGNINENPELLEAD